MIKQPFIILLIVVAFYPATPQSTSAVLDSFMSAYASQHNFHGAVLIAQKGKLLLHKGYGFRNAQQQVLNDSNSLFQIGSVTKPFTAAIILKLQEEKKLSVQDKLSKYMPDYPKGDCITVAHLLTHTSGIYNFTDNAPFLATEVSKPASKQKMIALIKSKPLAFEPGSQWQYSNGGYWLLGCIIEAVVQRPYEQVVRNYIFEPLQIRNSGFDFAHLVSKQKATGYFTLNDSMTTVAPIVDSSIAYAAGSMYTCTGDLYKWHKGLLHHIILSKASLDKAFTAVKNDYGYGWFINTVKGNRMISHSGGIHGFNSHFASIPEDDVCIVLLSNTANKRLKAIANDLLNIVYNRAYTLPKARRAVVVALDILPQYVGTYTLFPGFRIAITLNKQQLVAQATDQPAGILYAEKKDGFFLKAVDAQIQFTRDRQGRVTGLLLLQNGRKIRGKKVE